MTELNKDLEYFPPAKTDKPLFNGSVVGASVSDGKHVEILSTSMTASEMMLLGIPLDPDTMKSEDWEALPGIGPDLARTIVAYRQKYGDYGSIKSLHKVPGIGEKRIKRIEMYF
jgi:competence protein ComEA